MTTTLPTPQTLSAADATTNDAAVRAPMDIRRIRSAVGLSLGAAVALVLFVLLFVGSVEFGRMLGFGDLAVLFPLTAEFPVIVATLCWWELSHRGRSAVYPIVSFIFFLILTIEFQVGNVLLKLYDDALTSSLVHILVMTQAAIALALVVHLLIKTYAPELKGTVVERRVEEFHRELSGKPIFENAASRKATKDGADFVFDRAVAVQALARLKEALGDNGKPKTWNDIVAETGMPLNFVRTAHREYSHNKERVDSIVAAQFEGKK